MTASEAVHHEPATEKSTLQGLVALLADDATRAEVLEKAFDFRGDCTLTLTDGKVVTGYIFDRRHGATPADSTARLMTAANDVFVTVRYADIAKIEFGKDTAAGKSFETWMKKYIEKKMKGEAASIESEVL